MSAYAPLVDMSTNGVMCNNPLVNTAENTTENAAATSAQPDDSPWLSSQQQQIWRLWLAVQASSNIALGRQLAADSDLSLADYEILVHLSEAPDQRWRIAALADEIQWDRSRMSHQINRMMKRGLISKEACTEDGRGYFAVLQPQGLEVLRAAAPGHAAKVKELFFARLAEREQEQLLGLLEKLASPYTTTD